MKNLYIDFDGVIMNTIDVTYEELKLKGLNTNNIEDIPKIRKFYSEIDWKELLNEKAIIINDAMNCIKKIMDSNLYNVSILTHVNSLMEIVEKVKFIRKYIDDITIIPVPKDISKTEMVHVEGAILVDDYLGNLVEWKNKNGIGIKFSTKLNGKGFTVIDRLDQILSLNIIK